MSCLGDVDGDSDLDVVLGRFDRPDSLLVNRLRHTDAPSPARLGAPYLLELFARPGFATGPQVALPFVGIGFAVTPLALPPLGSWHLDPALSIGLSPVLLPAPTGTATVPLIVPPVAGLVGLKLTAQTVVAHGPALGEWRFTNAIFDVIQP